MLELKKGGRTRVQTEMVKFTALPFPSSKKKKLKIWSFHVRAGTAKECTEKHNSRAELLFC